MGMFDEVNYKGEILQTKDFDCEMRMYFIEVGRLLKDIGHYEEVPKENRPYPNEEGLKGMCGCIKWISEKHEDTNFHGILNAGEYEFKFSDGNLVSEIKESA